MVQLVVKSILGFGKWYGKISQVQKGSQLKPLSVAMVIPVTGSYCSKQHGTACVTDYARLTGGGV